MTRQGQGQDRDRLVCLVVWTFIHFRHFAAFLLLPATAPARARAYAAPHSPAALLPPLPAPPATAHPHHPSPSLYHARLGFGSTQSPFTCPMPLPCFLPAFCTPHCLHTPATHTTHTTRTVPAAFMAVLPYLHACLAGGWAPARALAGIPAFSPFTHCPYSPSHTYPPSRGAPAHAGDYHKTGTAFAPATPV